MHYSYVEIEYVATSFSPARMDLALKLLSCQSRANLYEVRGEAKNTNLFMERSSTIHYFYPSIFANYVEKVPPAHA
jgi:hypothetical protein